MEPSEGSGTKSFLIRDLLRDLIVKKPEISDEASDVEDSGNFCVRQYIILLVISNRKNFNANVLNLTSHLPMSLISF